MIDVTLTDHTAPRNRAMTELPAT